MDTLRPIHTETTECQDCYKCVRGCPVKAIRIENGSAMVMAERCLLCGHCVTVCPVGGAGWAAVASGTTAAAAGATTAAAGTT